jgi:hypothetical protein
MTGILVRGFAALALAAAMASPNPALAISHGCTPPTGVDVLTISVDVDGRRSQVRGGYCEAIQQAVALIGRSKMNAKGKQAAKQALAKLQARGDAQAARGRINWQLTAKCDSSGNCTVGGSIGGSF